MSKSLEKKHHRDPIQILNDDLIIGIFSYLNIHQLAKCVTVCEAWRQRLISIPTLWSNAHFSYPIDPFLCADSPQRRSFPNRTRVTQDSHIETLATLAGPSLQSVIVTYGPLITDASLESLVVHDCRNLVEMEFAPADMFSSELLATIIPEIGHKLRRLVLSPNVIEDDDLQTIMKECPSLDYLSVAGGKALTPEAFDLQKFYKDHIDSDDINSDSELFPRLSSINIAACSKMDDTVTMYIVSNFNNTLKHINLSECNNMTAHSLTLLSQCRFLEVILLNNMKLAENTVDGDDKRSLVLEFMGALPNLRILHIAGQDDLIDDEMIGVLARNSPNLEELDISDSLRITSESLVALGQFCKKLRILDVSGCWGCRDDGVIALIIGAQNLTHLDLSTLSITDASLRCIGNNSFHLKKLAVDLCQRITGNGIKYLLEGDNGLGCAFTLLDLSLIQCKNIDESVVEWCQGRLHHNASILYEFGSVYRGVNDGN
ncbi:hypothetical protein H4219_001428 [Mycoemilia scoparia]|uniref:F-box domain-containing protein n=1 Tax=Mycoemilia scoparia TaxID=417184 RepID=A0A9W8A0A3_9FUNG|nr:hypothetical protein H4219_001428 [Mycoemilia scoparia]